MNDAMIEVLIACTAGARSRRPFRFHGEALELEVIDILRADDETIERLRCDLVTVMLAAYTTAPQALRSGTASGPGEYLDHVLDRSVFDLYNTVAIVHAAHGPIAVTGGHVRRQTVSGRVVEVVRSGLHVAADRQGRGLSSLTFGVVALRYARRRLFVGVPRYVLGLCANPITYGIVHRRTRRVHPSPEGPIDPVMVALCELAFPGDERCGHLVAKPLAAHLDDHLQAYITTTDDPLIRFFLEQNPDFAEGYSLPLAIAMGPVDFVYAIGMHAWLAAQKLTHRRRPTRGVA